MKNIIYSEDFNFRDIVIKYKTKFNFLNFIKVNGLYYLLVLIINLITNLIKNSVHNFLKLSNLLSLFLFSLPYCVYNYLRDNLKSKRELSYELNSFLYTIHDNELDLTLNDLKKAAVLDDKEEKEIYYLCDGNGTKVNRKKVVSYIGVSKKEKLIIFKQIANHFHYENKTMKDSNLIELYLLDNRSMIDEGFLKEDGSLDKNNSLVKKLY